MTRRRGLTARLLDSGWIEAVWRDLLVLSGLGLIGWSLYAVRPEWVGFYVGALLVAAGVVAAIPRRPPVRKTDAD